MSEKILFVTHDCSRTGAPIVLLHFLKWLRANSSLSFQILAGRGGPLEPEFASLAPFQLLRPLTADSNPWWVQGIPEIKALDGLYRRSIIRTLATQNFDLVYGNTLVIGDILEDLAQLACPIITHAHELESEIRFVTGMKEFEKTKSLSTHWIAASEAVSKNLADAHGVPSEKVSIVHECIPANDVRYEKAAAQSESLRESLGISPKAKILGACATLGWRKSPEVFLQVARYVLEMHSEEEVHFIWVGGDLKSPRFGELKLDIERLGLDGRVHFVGVHKNPFGWFRLFDVFALVSREDPFPLVCLEAALLKKPIVCFEGAGGMTEFVEGDAGYSVPYLDTYALAKRVSELMSDDALRTKMGERAAGKVLERHTVDKTGPKILKVIADLLQ